MTSLGGFSCSPPSLVIPVFVFGDFSFCSSGAVSSSSSSCWGSRRLLLHLLGVSVQLVLEHLRFSAPCHAAGGPSEVPLLADSGWLLYSCGDGFAWGWGLSCNSCPVPPLVFFFFFFFFCAYAASPSEFCPLTEWIGMSVSSLLVYSSGWLGGVWLRPLPQGLQRPLFSLGMVCWASPAPLACGVRWSLHPVSGCSRCGVVCWVCRWGSPAAFSFPSCGCASG